ncbi:Vitamin K-dependent gamma-carboxylase [Botrimarina colliarenosi]|uniref:Vitamin K-dependent gamma-carboxylase n=1 Tax=Botrimarina colliarenosi TaxID=2528001 RepID=A0A5C6AKC4_9BACT|nr:DCC1-like thiol-disulfide oxidoreductase family protein [Botrimarina colliarenosi]TWU00100.1 Vitamin K-dependent gamma-carboxylase [Botrimarina colliarenosi]
MPRDRSLSTFQKIALAVLALGWLAVVVGSQFAVPPLIESAFDGESSDWLNTKIANHRAYRVGAGLDGSREWYAAWSRGYATKASALATLFAGVAGCAIGLPSVRRRFKRFLFASSAPLNLAVLRIAVFGMLLYLLRTELIETYAAWPREMYQFPLIAGWFYQFLPITPEVVTPLLTIATVTTVLAVFGVLTRATTVVSVLLGVYLIGIPQLSGKVNHLHHLLLIGAVLACSQCGDALSIDAIVRAFRGADRGVVAPPHRAVRYGLPIRLAMLVLATVYFFPGFWKVASNGPQWVFSNNLENHMLQKWFELETYTPPIPLHKAPFSGVGGALFAVVFELGLPIALLWKRSRAVWAMMGLTFHNLTNLLMNISFITLQVMYVMFVDWQRLLRWVGRRLLGEPIRVLYDGNCGLCRRTMAVLGVFDWLQQLKPVNALQRSAVEDDGLGFLEDAALMQDMHAAWRVEGRGAGDGGAAEWGTAKGFDAYQKIAWRVPLLWLTLPVIYLPPVAAMGWKVYRRVADSRACRVPTATKGAGQVSPQRRWSWKPLAVVAGTILLGQCVLGAGRLHKSWPLACYPLFDQIEGRSVVWPEFEAVTIDGERLPLDDDPVREMLGSARYVAPMKSLIEIPVDEARATEVLARFVEAWRDAGELPTDESTIERIVVSRARYELVGPERPAEPAEREPGFEAPWTAIQAAAEKSAH